MGRTSFFCFFLKIKQFFWGGGGICFCFLFSCAVEVLYTVQNVYIHTVNVYVFLYIVIDCTLAMYFVMVMPIKLYEFELQ